MIGAANKTRESRVGKVVNVLRPGRDYSRAAINHAAPVLARATLTRSVNLRGSFEWRHQRPHRVWAEFASGAAFPSVRALQSVRLLWHSSSGRQHLSARCASGRQCESMARENGALGAAQNNGQRTRVAAARPRAPATRCFPTNKSRIIDFYLSSG